MKTIWKYQLTAEVEQTIFMPIGAKILYAREQGRNICLWAEVDSSKDQEKRHIEFFPTGFRIKRDMGFERTYLGSAHINNGELVFHVYERIA